MKISKKNTGNHFTTVCLNLEHLNILRCHFQVSHSASNLYNIDAWAWTAFCTLHCTTLVWVG